MRTRLGTEAEPSVVTLGGGHGQAALLQALIPLRCQITAIVSVADDGGCSGKLREEAGMPPPGDLRRCLTTLARDRDLARRFEVRLDAEHNGRSAGNLALSEAFREFGSLQKAVDWAGELLECRGRVVPVAETGGILAVYDLVEGHVEGETNVEDRTHKPLVAIVHGPEATNPVAAEAIARADLIFIGPGSFVTSTLAAITTADVASAITQSPARKVFVQNLKMEQGHTDGFDPEDYLRMVTDHLVIGSMGEAPRVDVVRGPHDAEEAARSEEQPDGTIHVVADLACCQNPAAHDPAKLSQALVKHLGFSPRVVRSLPPPSNPRTEQAFEKHLKQATARLDALSFPPSDGPETEVGDD